MNALIFSLLLFFQPGENNPAAQQIRTEQRQEQLVTIRVSDRLVDCDGINGRSRCYQVQKGDMIGTDKWETLLFDIENFRFESGYEFDLSVKVVPLIGTNGETEGYRYELDKILSKNRIE